MVKFSRYIHKFSRTGVGVEINSNSECHCAQANVATFPHSLLLDRQNLPLKLFQAPINYINPYRRYLAWSKKCQIRVFSGIFWSLVNFGPTACRNTGLFDHE